MNIKKLNLHCNGISGYVTCPDFISVTDCSSIKACIYRIVSKDGRTIIKNVFIERVFMEPRQFFNFLGAVNVYTLTGYRRKVEKTKYFQLNKSNFEHRVKRVVSLRKATLQQNHSFAINYKVPPTRR